jgi:hypothetical protein
MSFLGVLRSRRPAACCLTWTGGASQRLRPGRINALRRRHWRTPRHHSGSERPWVRLVPKPAGCASGRPGVCDLRPGQWLLLWVTTSSGVCGSSRPAASTQHTFPVRHDGEPSADVGSGRQALLGLDLNCAVDDVGVHIRGRLERRRGPTAGVGRGAVVRFRRTTRT